MGNQQGTVSGSVFKTAARHRTANTALRMRSFENDETESPNGAGVLEGGPDEFHEELDGLASAKTGLCDNEDEFESIGRGTACVDCTVVA
ncbi:unnamed protein product [Toxocara canis]|uniref:Myelin basic protein n=1 Tax=Toxocara canis TaxID=6265 RepID=A0A183TUW7_TOXCA|nr:unnamed protein product [Toxocara canis]